MTFGRCCLVPNEALPAVVNQHVSIVRPNPEKLDSGFLLSFLVHPETKSYIESFNAGGSRRAITKGHIEKFEIPLPPLSEQREIAAILGALDDKIEMHRKTAATLEAMARALYRSWFVDFDPVWAKLEGRAPAHMDPTTAALFPDRFTEDGLPEGWEVVPYSEHIELVSGGTPKTSEPSYWGGDIPWYSVVDAPPPGMMFSHATTKCITEKGFHASAVNLVSKGVTIISARGTVGKLAMAGKDMVFNQSCYGLKGRSENLSAFTYFATEFAVERLQAMAHGAVFSTITRATFDGLQVIKAPPEIHQAFEGISAAILERIHSLGTESQTLASLRDSLLPRLMSGEISTRARPTKS